MIIRNEKNLVSKFHGDIEIVRKYHGDRLVWERDSGGLPAGYKRCMYLEGSGHQYIVSNITPLNARVCKSKATLNERVSINTGNYCSFGARNGTNGRYYLAQHIYNGFYQLSYGSGYNLVSATSMPRSSTQFTDFSTNNVSVSINDNTYKNTINYIAFDKPLFIFANNYNGAKNFWIGTISKIETWISIDGEQTSNFIPALDSSGKPCMYDTVTKQPFYNSGTGEFGYELMDDTYVAPI